MANFRTSVKLTISGDKINYSHPVLFIGSCFSNSIGNWLIENRFNCLVNPFGTIYNPVSIAKSLEQIIDNKIYGESDLFHYKGLWFSLSHYTLFSDTNKDKCLALINQEIQSAHQFIKQCNWMIITPGTAFVYLFSQTGEIVANCHKLPAAFFSSRMLSVHEIVTGQINLINRLRVINPNLKIIYTLSPVRHISRGHEMNCVSKSILRLAIYEIQNQVNDCYYFPAYEIVMDELRDYRFYATDMIHISDTAIAYIRERFGEMFLDQTALSFIFDLKPLIAARNHQLLRSNRRELELFILYYKRLIAKLSDKYPFIDFNSDIKYVSVLESTQ